MGTSLGRCGGQGDDVHPRLRTCLPRYVLQVISKLSFISFPTGMVLATKQTEAYRRLIKSTSNSTPQRMPQKCDKPRGQGHLTGTTEPLTHTEPCDCVHPLCHHPFSNCTWGLSSEAGAAAIQSPAQEPDDLSGLLALPCPDWVASGKINYPSDLVPPFTTQV